MASLKLSEIFETIQGEGPNVGVPTTFVRFGGCNLRCPGWPCDTLYAVLPEYYKEWEKTEVDGLVSRVLSYHPTHICITGGEPLIQPADQMAEFVETMLYQFGFTIDLFTNGSQLLPEWTNHLNVTVVLDYKLPGSGEYGTFLKENWERLNTKDMVKFVCKDRKDFDMGVQAIFEYENTVGIGQGVIRPQYSFGVAWGHLEEATLGEWLINTDIDATLNVQMHKQIGMS